MVNIEQAAESETLRLAHELPGGTGVLEGGIAMQTKYPEWKQHYLEALLEFDPNKLAGVVAATETAMFFRLQELNKGLNGHVERQAIADAANALLVIKRDILNFPGPDIV